jgi:hypothetical protein
MFVQDGLQLSPKEVIYGPRELFGLGIHNYYIEQGIQQLTALLGHVRQDSETSRMVRIELHWCQLQAGTEKHLLGDPTDPIDYIETCWIMCIRDFLRTYNQSVEFTATTLPRVQCSGDEFIMDGIQLRGGCTATELQRINAWRMFLQVLRVSDMSSANGQFLRHDALIGKTTTQFQSSTQWPRQGRPPREWWSLWCTRLKRAFSRNRSSADLWVPLSKWTSEFNKGEWDTLFLVMSGNSEMFKRRSDGKYDVYYTDTVGTKGNHYYVTDTESGRVDRLPADAVPAELGLRAKMVGVGWVVERCQTPVRIQEMEAASHLQSLCKASQRIYSTYCATPISPPQQQKQSLDMYSPSINCIANPMGDY